MKINVTPASQTAGEKLANILVQDVAETVLLAMDVLVGVLKGCFKVIVAPRKDTNALNVHKPA